MATASRVVTMGNVLNACLITLRLRLSRYHGAVLVLVPPRNALLFQLRIWTAQSPHSSCLTEVKEYLQQRLGQHQCDLVDREAQYSGESRNHDRASLPLDECRAMCVSVISHKKPTKEWEKKEETLDLVAAAAFEITDEESFRKAPELSKDSDSCAQHLLELNDYVAPTAVARSFVCALNLDPTRKLWRDINWWISLHGNFQARMDECDATIASYIAHRQLLTT